MDWQLIETAPQNGDCILVANPRSNAFSGFYVAYWSKSDRKWLYATGLAVPKATHWMPLPEAPK